MRRSHLPPSGHSQSGNALFLILIAVSLFAALAYAITSSSRGGGSIDKEQAVLLAAQITQQGAAIRTTITRMILTGTPSDLVAGAPSTFFAYSPHPDQVFWDTEYGAYGTDPTNELFNPAGGGLIFPVPPENACDAGGCHAFGVPGWGFGLVAVDGAGTAETDAIASFFGMKLDVCNAINKGLDLGAPPALEDDLSDGINPYPGSPGGCFDTGLGVYVYYHVLLER